MKINLYKLSSGALFLFSATLFSQTTYTFNYTGGEQTKVLQPGTYTIEAWGANGGDNLGNGTSTYLQNGGRGGYSKGVITLASAITVYINVGGRGDNSTSVLNATVAGGYNGGAYGSFNTTAGKSSGAGGGGASHVATSTGILSSLSGNTTAVMVVAGGGGGAGESNYASNNAQYNSNGGDGGGLSGLQIVSTGYQGRHGKGGTQTAGGTGGDNGAAAAGPPLQGIFGEGGYNPIAGTNSSAGGAGIGGGGGGWYGGGAGWGGAATGYCAGSGGGGSGYIGGVTTGTTVAFGQTGYIPNPDLNGDGMVLLTEACSISLSVTGLNANGDLCQGNSITISTDAVSNYTWTDGSFGPVLVATPATSTVYGLTAVSPSNCISSAQVSITVHPLPVVNATTSAQAICFGESVVLSADGADTYSWSTNATVPTITLSPNQTTTYSVTGTNTLTGCDFTDMVTVNVLKPTVAIIGNSVICKGNTTTLTAFGDGATFYSWSTGSPGQSIIESPATHSIYAVTANVTTLNVTCSALSNFTVLVNPLPKIVANPDRFAVCLGETAEFSATGGVSYSWQWQTETSNGPTFVVGAEQLGSISVNVTGTDANGCSNSAMVTVQVYACTGLNEQQSGKDILNIYPNPSQGDINISADLEVIGAELDLLLFNQTGQVVRKVQLNATNEYKANISDLSGGIYFITGINGDKRINSKITITR